MTPNTITVDLPGIFAEWFAGSSPIEGDHGTTDPLYIAWQHHTTHTRGKGHTIRLAFPLADAEDSLARLARYANTLATVDDATSAERAAARTVIRRCLHAHPDA